MNQALILVDIQKDYFQGGKMELVGMEEAADNAKSVLRKFREKGLPIFHIQHISMQPGASFFLPDSDGAHIHDTVEPLGGEPVFEKHFPSSFRDTGLLAKLQNQGIEEIIVCGAMSHMCIDTTVRAAFDLGLRCIVVADACATRDLVFAERTIKAPDVHGAYMAALGAVFARVVVADGVVPLLV